MQIFPSVLLHKKLQAILLLRNLTISFHSSCVWILAENWGKRCCPSLPPGSVVSLRLCSYPTPATVPLLNGPSKDLAVLQLHKLPNQLQNPVCQPQPCVCECFPGKAAVQHSSGWGIVLWGIPTGSYPNPDLAVLPLTSSHQWGVSWWLQDPEITDPEEKHFYLTWFLVTQQSTYQPFIFLRLNIRIVFPA